MLLLLNFLFIKVSTKTLSSIKVFSIGLNNFFYEIKNKLKHQVGILEWFLKDHVTLKTGVMAA